MFGYPFPPQRSIQEQIEDQERLVKFLKEKYKGEEKKPWYQTKLSLWETAFIIAIFSSIAALPITLWIIGTVLQIKQIVNGL